MAATSKHIVLVVSLILSLVSLVLLFGVTWHFQLSLDLLQHQVEYDRELLVKLQERFNVSSYRLCQAMARHTDHIHIAIATYD